MSLDQSELPEGSKALREKTHSMSGLIDATHGVGARNHARLRRRYWTGSDSRQRSAGSGRVSASQRHPLQTCPFPQKTCC